MAVCPICTVELVPDLEQETQIPPHLQVVHTQCLRRLTGDGNGDRHVLHLNRDGQGFFLHHPLACRPNLFACPVNQHLGRLDEAPADPGQYEVVIRADGYVELGERVGEAVQ